MTDRPISFIEANIHALHERRKSQTRRTVGPVAKLQPGDRLWVREPFHLARLYDRVSPTQAIADHSRAIAFAADGAIEDWGRRRFARELPKLLHRMHLVITEVRVEPLQDLSEADARAEGVADRAAYATLWDEIHAAGKYTIGGTRQRWRDNPQVVALTFDVVDAPL